MTDAFSRFYADVNAEWPPFRQTADESLAQERRWRFALGHYPSDALDHAMRRALAQCKQRPRAAELVEWAQEGSPKGTVRHEHAEAHWTRCACHCGGLRWWLVLRDGDGAVRVHADTVQALLGRFGSAALPRVGGLLPALETLVGEPMRRAKVQCNRRGGDPLPDDRHYLGLDVDLVPVYDLAYTGGARA